MNVIETDKYSDTAEYASACDKADILAVFREGFCFPHFQGEPVQYFVGNSLGLQPKRVAECIQHELDDWATFGVDGHVHAQRPWFSYHETLNERLQRVVGAETGEVVVTHSLTTNLHLLMVSFYRPAGNRYKILCEHKAFPSDLYALESQLAFHGYSVEDALIELKPREGEACLRTEDILQTIEDNKDTLALVMMGGVNYYTGQLFNMKLITEAAHRAGAIAGFDLAHAAGNVALELHNWNVDFAAWCSYKYLNSGPGGVSGLFVHNRHAQSKLPRFAGWWGHNKQERFKMQPGFNPIAGAEGWQLSNAPVISMAVHSAALEDFEKAGMKELVKKSRHLTGYLEYLIQCTIKKSGRNDIYILTPSNPEERGCQLSLVIKGNGKKVYDYLSSHGVMADWREPEVIRLAPVPLYNSYKDVYVFSQKLEKALQES
jgi:kynureninase